MYVLGIVKVTLVSLGKLLEIRNLNERLEHVFAPLSEGVDWVQVEGLASSAKGLVISHLFHSARRPMLVLTYSQDQAEQIADDVAHFGVSKESICFYPASESLIYGDTQADYHIAGERLAALHALAAGSHVVVVASIEAVLRRTLSRDTLLQNVLNLSVGESHDIDSIAAQLVRMGYEPTELVERHGEFCRRGGLVDVYASNEDNPLRIEFFGDEIESIRHFDTQNQRSFDKLSKTTVLPAREVVLTPENAARASKAIKHELDRQIKSLIESGDGESAQRIRDKVEDDLTCLQNMSYFDDLEVYLPFFYSEESSILDFLPAGALMVVDEPGQVVAHWERHEEQLIERLINRAGRGMMLGSQQKQYVSIDSAMKHACTAHQVVSFTLMPRHVRWASPNVSFELRSVLVDSFNGSIPLAMDQIKTWHANGVMVVVATPQEKRMKEILGEYEIPCALLDDAEPDRQGVFVTHASLRRGFSMPEIRLVLLTDSEVFGARRLHKPRRPTHEGVLISSVLDLKEGDYVVHVNHGIARYKGIERKQAMGSEREYLALEYAHGDMLYVPTEQIDRVQKYMGGEENAPAIHRLGGSDWSRVTSKVRKAVEQVARELVELYAWREAVPGTSFGSDTEWQREMESAFPYEETPDQLDAIKDVKKDLEKPRAMDRLICGDVGYGKTEVAIRAAFKVAADGKQVAVLAPTTVLAQQHFNTFTERLAAFPIRVALLSRFKSRKEQLEAINGLKVGYYTIVIGTHRLLSKDVQFKDLGLLILDEEHRFGVRHKERLKQLRKSVDVLTMTATPIPRTLNMSLAGIRDMSVINDPPEGRMPISTYLKPAEPDIVRNAIVRELDRGGQVFFVHNRVDNIYHMADQLAKLVPYARIEVGHGQMSEGELERVMMDFYDGKFDVLVCTTIIESGLDIPNANTIVINDSDKLGLAQLYQLRGRVGRSDRQAFAYLLHRPNKQLTDIAEKRLAAIREFTDLGSGFRVAMRDLEIRGAGNLLGTQQSGNMAAVGFDLYCQLLSRAVKELKGEDVEEEADLPIVDLPVDAFIPVDYVSNEGHRILFYKQLAAVRSISELEAIQAELEDRFGDPPRPVWNTLAVLRLRLRCRELGVSGIGTMRNEVHIHLAEKSRLTPIVCRELIRAYKRTSFQPDRAAFMFVPGHILSETEDMVEILAPAIRKSAAAMAGR